jgi:hypothetical protein
VAIGGGVHVWVCSGGIGELEDVEGTDVHDVGVWVPSDGCDSCVCMGFEVSQVEREYWMSGLYGGVSSVKEVGDA